MTTSLSNNNSDRHLAEIISPFIGHIDQKFGRRAWCALRQREASLVIAHAIAFLLIMKTKRDLAPHLLDRQNEKP